MEKNQYNTKYNSSSINKAIENRVVKRTKAARNCANTTKHSNKGMLLQLLLVFMTFLQKTSQ